MRLELEAIPSSMQELQRWVLWRLVRKKGAAKPTKPPYNALTGANASTTDAATWATFQTATEKAMGSQYWNGIGFVFSAEDDLMGIDLDHCVNPETGTIEPWAAEIVQEMNTYTEVSPSGDGLHLIFRAQFPMKGRKNDRVEVYQAGRYFTMTGRAIANGFDQPQPRQAEASTVIARHFPPHPEAKAPAANGQALEALAGPDWDIVDRLRNNPKYDALWRGDIQGYPSHSEADLALTGMIAFYAGPDPARIDRLFRQSGLWRDKWDDQHGTETYGELTIAEALKGKLQFYEWRVPAGPERRLPAARADPSEGEDEAHPFDQLVYTGSQLLAAAIAEPEWLIEGFVARAVMTMLVGIGKIGKSVLGHQSCVAAASAGVWLDRRVPFTRALYVNWEDPLGLTRARAVQQFAPTLLPDSYLTMQPPWGSSFNGFLAWLERYVQREEIGYVVIDPLAIAAGWRDENDNSEVGPTLRTIQEVAQRTGAAILVVHHTRKSPGDGGLEVRGGSAIFAGVQGFLSFRRKGEGLFELAVQNKMPGEHSGDREVMLQRLPHTLTWQVTETTPSEGKQINIEELLTHLRADPGMTREELASDLGVSMTTLRRYVTVLLDGKQIVEAKRLRRPDDVGKTPMGLYLNSQKRND